MKLLFIGSGYVGLVSGIMLAHLGHDVICLDEVEAKINLLNAGKLPIYEPGLEEYFHKALEEKKLSFTSNYEDIKFIPDAVFITVGTPSLPNGNADLQYVISATINAASKFKDTIIVIKSTVPPGTLEILRAQLENKGYGNALVSNPEFLSEGKAVKDFMCPDRIVIGTLDNRAAQIMKEIYSYFNEQNYPILFTPPTTSELIKYASNSFLATKIAFINEMANLCEKIGGDVDILAEAIGLDPRIGKDFLKTGPGFGGSCFPKDILALQYLSNKNNQPCYILNATIESNQKRILGIVNKIENILGDLKEKTLAVFGLTFKAGTDDVRSSPAIEIVKLLAERGAYISAFDPLGMKNASAFLNIDFAENYISATKNANGVVILTEWPEFKNINYDLIAQEMKDKIIFDFRNILDAEEAEKSGFKIYQLGKKINSA